MEASKNESGRNNLNTIGNVQTGIALESWRSNLNTNQVTIGHESFGDIYTWVMMR